MEVLVSTVSDKFWGGERMSAGRFMPSLPFLVKVPISLFKTARKEAVRQKSWDLNRIVTSPRRVRTLHRSNYTACFDKSIFKQYSQGLILQNSQKNAEFGCRNFLETCTAYICNF